MKYKLTENIILGNTLIHKGSILCISKDTEARRALKDTNPEELETLYSIDPTGTKKKYVDWLYKLHTKDKIPYEDLAEFIKDFDKVSKKIKGDFTSFNYGTALDKIEEAKGVFTKGEKRRNPFSGLSNSDYKFITENELAWVAVPLTYKASCQFGQDTGWCISDADRSNYYSDYEKKLKTHYMFIPKDPEGRQGVITVDKNGSIYDTAWRGEQPRSSAAQEILDKFNISKSILKPIITEEFIEEKREIQKQGLYKKYPKHKGALDFIFDSELDIAECVFNSDGTIDYNEDVKLSNTDIQHIPFKNVDGYLNLGRCTSLKTLGQLKSVGGHLYLNGCTSLKTLGNLQSVDGDLYLNGCISQKTLGNLENVAGDLDLQGCTSLKTLGNLESVEGTLNLEGCTSLKTLGNLHSVDRNLFSEGCTSLNTLGNLQSVGWNLYLRGSRITLTDEEIREQVKVGGSIIL